MQLPQGYRAAAVACGIKKDPATPDLCLIVSDKPAAAGGVLTQNRVPAPPVRISRQRVPSGCIRAIVANSGNANACTGDGGLADARRMTELVASQIGCSADAVLVCSTGIIGARLPMENIQ